MIRMRGLGLGLVLSGLLACGNEAPQLGGEADPAADGGAEPDLGADAEADLGAETGPDGAVLDARAPCQVEDCEGEAIQIPRGPSIELPPCCLEAPASGCGYDLSEVDFAEFLGRDPGVPEGACIPQRFEGELDPSCPEQEVELGPVQAQLRGCCRPDGTCGVNLDLSLLGGPRFGCIPTRTGTDTSTRCGDSGG
ncbi:MAG TPA: hypothetical protein RMG48_08875 [Myxococcales bacterium LLY-WYZ-16_1]|nr:hypothetical protein [Myxococcales bacterium LLY-WYZ-16_1]